jgi:FKBP-type peptidyl-prolyl cis-trans isomerase SlpA|tara:strand:+ start:583 stop:1023 length:441 start_codon:yes stop_codon:yes gene_type:complete
MALLIDSGTRVTMHFALALENGHVVDSNFDGAPATFMVGDGNLLPGFETQLMGLSDGDEREFLIPPESAFGQHNPQNVQDVDRSNFSAEEVELGTVFSFQNGEGELPGVVIEVGKKEVRVDFNHPLAGQTISFKVKIMTVAPQSVH